MGDVADQVGDLTVGQVPVARTDPLFDRPGPFGVRLQQALVVVCLHKNTRQPAQSLGHAARHKTRIGEEAQSLAGCAQHKADRVHRVVLDRESFHRDPADGKGLAGFEKLPRAAFNPAFPNDPGGRRSGEHRHGVLLEKNLQPADVVAVFVGD